MSILIDSADIEEVRQAMELGWVAGVTTNPALIAKTNRPVDQLIAAILEASRGPVFCQLTTDAPEQQEAEARHLHALAPDRIVLKIPAATANLSLLARLRPETPCALTAVYAGHQALAACEAGARYLIPYVNRATRLLGDGLKLVGELSAVAERAGTGTEILAASIKTPEEASEAFLAGADHLTLPFDVILRMGDHDLSERAIKEFRQVG
ncbi:MAG: transaldolase [candidate division WOR-3 bacterium]|nr:MAG: transaldolase [candidate division WOR-3 bacterium]